ncbi:MAG: SapB/AmfS family lanthipeptide [Actinobacteria bacterium]|nr:SapB/AmfS family lanthipeptide [Actinomycetota bacterium]
MAILDLQGMQAPSSHDVRYGKSASSKGCNNIVGTGGGRSGLSLLLC